MRIYGCVHLHDLDDELARRGLLRSNATVMTHQLEFLLRIANCLDRIQKDRVLRRDYNTVNEWAPVWRYSADLSNREEAEDFVAAVEKMVAWINSNL